MSLSDLSSLLPPIGKTDAFWITRFQARSLGDGGEEAYRIFYADADATAGGQPGFLAGSSVSSQGGVPGNGCVTTTPDNCKVVQYPAQETVTGSLLCDSKLVIDVPLQSGFGANRPICDTLLYNVTAFSGGRNNATTDIYADVDGTRSFDFNLANACPGPMSTVPAARWM